MPTTENPSQILEATEGFVAELNGERFIVNIGNTRISASHPLAKAYPERFRPIEAGLSYADDMTMTAEPGQSRSKTRKAPSQVSESPETAETKEN